MIFLINDFLNYDFFDLKNFPFSLIYREISIDTVRRIVKKLINYFF